jgi:uncharacterized protein YndB with AHSA1/START domain
MADDFSTIEQRVWVKADCARVWRALSDRTEFETWFRVRLDAPLAIGAANYMSEFGDGEAIDRFWFEVLEMEADSHILWKWHPGAHDASVDYTQQTPTMVRIALAPHLDGTMVTVTETGFDAIAMARRPSVLRDNVNGWLEQVASLRKYVDGQG